MQANDHPYQLCFGGLPLSDNDIAVGAVLVRRGWIISGAPGTIFTYFHLDQSLRQRICSVYSEP